MTLSLQHVQSTSIVLPEFYFKETFAKGHSEYHFLKNSHLWLVKRKKLKIVKEFKILLCSDTQ